MDHVTRFPWEYHGETLIVETPEQTKVEYRIAAFGTRIVAALLDQIRIVSLQALFVAVGLLGGLALGWEGVEVVGSYWVAFLLALNFLISMFYFVWFEVRTEGQTPGKRRFRIRSVMISGRGLTAGSAVIRNFARLLDNIPVLWVVPALSKGNRRLGDLLAGTVVVDERQSAPETGGRPAVSLIDSSRADLGELRFYFSAEIAERLHRDDLNLLEFLETRLRSAPRARRLRLMREVAVRYLVRLGLEAERERILADPQRFLQELGLFLQERFEGRAY